MVFENEPKYMMGTKVISDDKIEKAKEKYHDEAEEFLDTVFDHEAKIERKTWEKEVSKKMKWLFDP